MPGGRGRTAWTAPPGGHCLHALPGSGRATPRLLSARPSFSTRPRLAALFPGAPPAWSGLPPQLEGTQGLTGGWAGGTVLALSTLTPPRDLGGPLARHLRSLEL